VAAARAGSIPAVELESDPLGSATRNEHDRYVALARDRLVTAAFDAAWASGSQLSVDDTRCSEWIT
jgi:hypothetical protein